MELFGPNFEGFSPVEEAVHPHPHPPPTATEDDPAHGKDQPSVRVDKAKKGKILAKATGLKYQFQILESIGVPLTEVKKFADPYHWLEYFPPIAIVSTSCDFSAAAKMKLRMQYRRQTIVL